MSGNLIEFDHELQMACDTMQRKGLLVDEPYTVDLNRRFETEIAQWQDVAASFGCSNVEASRDVASALQDLGAEFTEFTAKTGQPVTDRNVLEKLAETHADTDVARLIEAIFSAKRMSKRKASYTDHMLYGRDALGRIHASINTLGARTARMSVSNPPLQQLPSREALIRLCIIARPGFVIISCDFSQIEMRIAAALAGETRLILAAQREESIHAATCRLLFPDWNGSEKADVYKLAKGAGLAWLYGSGPAKMAKQSGVPLAVTTAVHRKYGDQFSNLSAWKREGTERVLREALTPRQYSFYKSLRREMWDYEPGHPRRDQIEAKLDDITRGRTATLVCPSGRRLKVDASKPYSVANYEAQNTAREIMGAAILRAMKVKPLADTLLLPIHDELLAEVPEDQADTYVATLAEVMSTTFGPVPITAEGEICGRSWGDAYVK